MPTYVYKCSACQHTFERFERITAKPDKRCPKCKKKRAERQISGGAGVIFKGSGFYSTDYRSKSYQADAKKQGASNNGASKKEACPSCGDPSGPGSCATEKKSSTPSKAAD